MVEINHRIGIKAPVSKVYDAIATVNGVANWWTEETTGRDGEGSAVDLVFRAADGNEKGRISYEIAELDRDRKVRWRFTAGPAEWIGTDATFDLQQNGDYTIVLFRHSNWQKFEEFTAHCSTKWATFMLSLRDLVETGAGRPSPRDLKIDNWN